MNFLYKLSVLLKSHVLSFNLIHFSMQAATISSVSLEMVMDSYFRQNCVVGGMDEGGKQVFCQVLRPIVYRLLEKSYKSICCLLLFCSLFSVIKPLYGFLNIFDFSNRLETFSHDLQNKTCK